MFFIVSGLTRSMGRKSRLLYLLGSYFIATGTPRDTESPMHAMDALWLAKHAQFRPTATPVLYHCEPIWSWKSESLPDFAIWGILEGSGSLSQNGEKHSLEPGYCFLFSPHDRIEADQDPLDPLSLFVTRFEILDTSGEAIPAHQLKLERNPVQTRTSASLSAIANLALAWDPENEIENRIQDHALRLLLLLIADAAHPAFDERVAKASALVDSDLGRKWTLEELADASGLSPSQFSRLFSRQYGEPPIQNLIHRRMKEARKLVLETSLSLHEIGTRLGYENQRFFERQFLKHVGFPAESLRRNRAL